MKANKNSRRIKLICGIIIVIILWLLAILFIIKPRIFKPSLDEIKKSVVKIEVYDYNKELIATGSGFCAYKDNYIVTNYHVINSADSIKIITDDNKKYDIDDIIIFDPENDLAIISGDFLLEPLKLGKTNNLSTGKKVTTIGSPIGVLNSVSEGIISNYKDSKEIQITAPISPGSSGGVLLDNHYHVIGITSSSLVEGNNLNFAIKIDYLNKMKKSYDKNDYFKININTIESCTTFHSNYSLNELIKCGKVYNYYSTSRIDMLSTINEM